MFASAMVILLCLLLYYCYCFFFFFFQAEDGIRDRTVTGVQTCALPISLCAGPELRSHTPRANPSPSRVAAALARLRREGRSEERRVGKECRSRWWAEH